MTEATPFLQKYDITFLRPPSIAAGSLFYCLYFFQPFPCPQSQRQLGDIRHYEGKYALGEGGKKRYGPLRVAVNLYEPEGAEGIAGQQAEEQRQRLSPKPRLIAAEQAIDGAYEQKANYVAAGGPEKRPHAAVKAGKHRRAHSAQQYVQRYGYGPVPCAQKQERQENAEGLHGEGGLSGYRQPCAGGEKSRAEGDACHAFCSHTVSVISSVLKK